MPTARSTARSTGTVYRTWSYLRYVSHISVWYNSIHPPNTSPNKSEHTTPVRGVTLLSSVQVEEVLFHDSESSHTTPSFSDSNRSPHVARLAQLTSTEKHTPCHHACHSPQCRWVKPSSPEAAVKVIS